MKVFEKNAKNAAKAKKQNCFIIVLKSTHKEEGESQWSQFL